jgi:hypothetical protein
MQLLGGDRTSFIFLTKTTAAKHAQDTAGVELSTDANSMAAFDGAMILS